MALGGLLSLLGVSLWQVWPDGPGQGTQHWVQVQPQRVESRLGLVGKVQSGRQVILSAPFDGALASVLVQEGQRVIAGQPLMRLDTRQIDIQLRQAEAERLRTRALVTQLRTWPASPEVARSLRVLGAARAALAAGQAALDETRRLFERGIVARMEVDSLEQLQQAQREAVLDAQQELQLTRARGQGDVLAIAEMELENAEARWQALAAMREQRVLRAPFDGLLARVGNGGASTALPLQEGQALTQGMPLLVLSDLERLQVNAGVEERDVGSLREGMEVGAIIAGHLLVGRLSQIGQQPRNDTGQGAWYDVVVDLNLPVVSSELGLRLGMGAQLALLLQRREQAIVLPPEALRRDEAGRTYVVFREGDEQAPRKVPVTVGITVAQGVEVNGLQSGFVQLP